MKHDDPARPYIRAAYERNHFNFALMMLATIADGFVSSMLAVLLQLVIDTATGAGEFTVTELVYISAGITALFAATELMAREFESRFLRKANRQYKARLFLDLTRKNIASFSSEKTGTYISMLTTDATMVEEKYFRSIPSITRHGLLGTLSLGLMVWYNWQLALVAVGLGILPVVLSVAFGTVMSRTEAQVSDRNAGFVALVKDLLSGFSVIKSFQAESEAQSLFDERSGELEQTKFFRYRVVRLVMMLAGGAGFLTQIGVFLVGALFATKGWITPGVIVAFLQLSGMAVQPIQALPELIASRKAAKDLIGKAAGALADNTRQREGQHICCLGDGICCEALRFGYEDGTDILKGIDLHFEPGKSYGIVGASGSGKSTLLNLLLGSYDSYRGSITIGGLELKEVSAESLYELLSIIQQNVFIFDSTIADNITMFKSCPEDVLRDAVRRSGLEELIAEKGLDHRCGENGCNLSGGERQRISIARCLMKNTRVLLMDEATAALDAQTAANVTNAILDIDGLTRIIVTHKLDDGALKRFDELLVLRGGVIAERGTFEELTAARGYFHSLYTVSKSV